ncbi:hypothetical protein EBX31_13530 [bacterium]|nr:hypothetical protein [bacterium]
MIRISAPFHSGILSISGWVHGPPASIALPIPINPSSIPSGPSTFISCFFDFFIFFSFFIIPSSYPAP